MSLKLIITALLSSFACAQDIKFSYDLEGTQCFSQNLNEDLECNVIVKTESTNVLLQIQDPKGRELDRQMGYTKMDKKFVVKNSGQHQICLTNNGRGVARLELEIKSNDGWGESVG